VSWVVLTAPNGEPLLVNMAGVFLVRPQLPSEEQHDGEAVGTAVFAAGQRWLVKETFVEVAAILDEIGLSVRGVVK
jgi:hypothetical protein